MPTPAATWPDLALPTLEATTDTLQLWSQIVGKIRLSQTPWLNHSWHVTLYVSARGLTTGPIPHEAGGFENVRIAFCGVGETPVDASDAAASVRLALKVKDPRIVPEMGAHVAFLGARPAEHA